MYDAVKYVHWMYQEEEEDVKAPLHAYAVTSSYYRNTWYSTDRLCNIVRTKKGCGAGLPLADLTFALLVARIQYAIVVASREFSCTSNITFKGKNIEFHPVSFHDDMCIPITGGSGEILGKVKTMAEQIFQNFRLF